MTARADRISVLFDFLADRPDGATINQIADHLEVSSDFARDLVLGLRDMLGDDDSINVVCERDPSNPKGQWLYRLVGDPAEARVWTANRVVDAERRIRTIYQVVRSTTVVVDGRTAEGKRGKIMRKQLGRLLEDLDELPV